MPDRRRYQHRANCSKWATARRRCRLEFLERRDLLSGQTPLITDATPYSAAFAEAVFRDALGRTADASGLAWFVQQLDSGLYPQQLAMAAVHSDEYMADTVQSAYQQSLERAAEPGAINYWSNTLNGGLREEQLQAALVASDEFYARAGGNDTAWVSAAYQTLLGRAPEASAVDWATRQLALGASRGNLALTLAFSSEAERRFADGAYARYFHVSPNSSALDLWTAQLIDGQVTRQLFAGELMSTEAYYEEQTGVPQSVVPVPVPVGFWASRDREIEAAAARGTAQVAFFGDSLTEHWQDVGQAVWNESYAGLNALNAGIAADKTQNVLYRIENGDLNGLNPKVVVVMAGVNNLIFGDTPQEAADGVSAVVEALRQRLPDAKILVLGILPAAMEGAEDNLMATISATNQMIAGLADEEHVFFLNMWSAFTYADGGFDPTLPTSDGLHLNQQGYVVWRQTMAPELDYLLAS
ncbi:MAG TPA: GDSL-type esterase/lipase family protein [Pirellulales bacterium]|nr:GDSL-type esterase/lipase family protein [Pirellulales bacterium]